MVDLHGRYSGCQVDGDDRMGAKISRKTSLVVLYSQNCKARIRGHLHRLFWKPPKFPTPPKKYLPNFSTPQKSWNQKFECPKNPSIISFTWNPGYPSGGRSSVHSSKLSFPWVKMLSARYWGGGGRWGTRLGQQNSKIYITCLRQDYLFYYPV